MSAGFPRVGTLATIVPFALWMALMLALPNSLEAYALRTAVVGFLVVALVIGFCPWRQAICDFFSTRRFFAALGWGFSTGIVAFFIWVLPEQSEWYRRFFIIGPAQSVDASLGSRWLLTVKVIGSAFVIAPVEELFYRHFLYRFVSDTTVGRSGIRPIRFDLSAFLWTTLLFAAGHNRFLVAAIVGAAYCLVAVRVGLAAAIVAHITTNLILGFYVLKFAQWQFW